MSSPLKLLGSGGSPEPPPGPSSPGPLMLRRRRASERAASAALREAPPGARPAYGPRRGAGRRAGLRRGRGAGRGRAERRCSRRAPGFVCGGAGPCPGGMALRRPPAACLPAARPRRQRSCASCERGLCALCFPLLSLPLCNWVFRSRWLKVGSYRRNLGWFVQVSVGEVTRYGGF